MKINFCLPGPSKIPIGGYKIVFEYANRLVEKGHEVGIVFDCKQLYTGYHFPEFLRRILSYYAVKTNPRWFLLNKKVKKIYANGILDHEVPDADIVIATAILTVHDVHQLSSKKGKKVYFIQDFENWGYTDEEVYETYGLNMKNIVIAKWLKEIVDKHSHSESVYIPNGIDLTIYGIDIPITERNPYSISMMYRKEVHKGTKYGLEAINRIKELYPNVEVRLFGVPDRPEELPDWIEYTTKATQSQLRTIYNHSAIYLTPSVIEGFGLTGAESMACGCALVSTAYQGVFEYAENNKNALISPVRDVDALVNNIERLFNDNELRIKMATKGNTDIKKLSWENSVNLFEKTLEGLFN